LALVEDIEDLKHQVARLSRLPLLALDLETNGLDPHVHRPVLLTLGTDRELLQVDCRKISLEPLIPLLSGPIPKIAHNGAFDAAMLRSAGIRVENLLDTMLIEQVIRSGGGGKLSLAALAEQYLGMELDKSERLTFAHTDGSFSPAQLEYAKRDVLAAYEILLEQTPLLDREGLKDTARLECQAVTAFSDLMFDGIFLDQKAWSVLVDEAKKHQEEARAEIERHLQGIVDTDLFGRVDFNFESDAEWKEILTKLTKRPVREVNKQALKALGHPIGELLLRYREAGKIVSTYGENFLEFVHPRTGRIHAKFHQIGAPTGRVSCKDPNLQSIPRGSRFRNCFSAPKGHSLVTADYSGCELRILAEMSGDPAFVQTFKKGGDLHSIVASEIFGVTVNKEQNRDLRDRAKAINFGLAYGMGAGGLAQVTGMPQDEAERLLVRYFAAYPEVKNYLESSAALGLERGFARTLGGRRLFLQVSDASEEGDPASVARIAKNMPIQGTNADMLKLSMAGIRRRLLESELSAFMVNCVHDEILVQAESGDAWAVADLMKEEMIQAGERYIKKVPVEVDVGVSGAWQK
jgi:DNA polymerase I